MKDAEDNYFELKQIYLHDSNEINKNLDNNK